MYVVWKGDYYPDLPQPLPIIMRKRLSWDDIIGHGGHCTPSGSDILGQRI